LTTYPGIEASPTFSPDGKYVAFSWDGGTGDAENIYVVIVGSDSPLQLTAHPARDVAPAWKPDGSQIAFARLESGRASIYVVSPLGGSERKLADFDAVPAGTSPIETSNPNLSWSPDGRWLAVSRVASAANTDVSLVSEDGSVRGLIQRKDGVACGVATFSPTGDALACINDGYIDIFVLRGTNPPSAIVPARRVTPFLGFVSGLAWADAKTILFGRAHYQSPDPPSLWRVAAAGGAAPERIDLAGAAGYPAVSTAGARVAFVRRDLNNDLLLLQQGRPPEPLAVSSTFNEQDASFSPDGSKVAFASDRIGESNEIWIALTKDAASRRSLTKGARKPEGTPRWSPDGRRIAFDGLGDDGYRHVYLVDEAGGPLRAVPGKAGSRELFPSWSHDGKWIYYASRRTGRFEIWRWAPDSGETQQMTTTGGDRPFESADGRTLYFARSIDGVWTLFEQPLAGGPDRPLGLKLAFWNYVPVRDGLIYMAPRQGPRPPFTFEVRFFDAATRRSRLIYSLPMVDAAPGLSVLPDGKTVLIGSVMHYGQDLMRLDNFK